MKSLIIKELKDFSSSSFSIFAVALMIILTYSLLWVFPDSSYTSFGLAEGDLYFEFLSYLSLFVVPIFSVGFLANEYKYGTEELLRSLSISWRRILGAKFFAALVILILILALTSVHLIVVYQLSMSGQPFYWRQVLASYVGILGMGACYISISLMITSFVEQTTMSLLISVVICFFLYSGLSIISELPSFEGGLDYWLDRLSLSFHAEQISRGVLRLSSIVYIVLLTIWSLWVAAHRLSTKEV